MDDFRNVIGMIVSPIILGVIFFLIFSPIGILMRLFGRDELHLQQKNKSSFWINREQIISQILINFNSKLWKC